MVIKRIALACLSVLLILSLLPTASAAGISLHGSKIAGLKARYASASSSPFASDALPEAVDNSTSNYFPSIGQAYGYDDMEFATTYYLMTYETAKARDWDVKAGGHSRIFSPTWTKNLSHNGNASIGNAIDILSNYGALFWDDLPYYSSSQAWPTTAEQWREALRYRIKSDYVHDIDSQSLKESLSAGKICVIETDINSWHWESIKDNTDSTSDDNEINKFAASYMDNTDFIFGALVIVGYNDSIWIDRNDDNTIQLDELGAFKVANSAGTSWKNDGFAWFAYSAINDNDNGHKGIIANNGALFFEADSKDYTPLVTAEINITTSNRQSLLVFKGINWSEAATPNTLEVGEQYGAGGFLKVCNYDKVFYYNGGSYSLQGNTTLETGTIVVDLTDLIKGGGDIFPNNWQSYGGPLSYCIGIYNPYDVSYKINSVIFQIESTGARIDAQIPDDTLSYHEMQWYNGVGVLNPDKAAPYSDPSINALPSITENVPAHASLSQASPVVEWKFVPSKTGSYIFSNDGGENVEYSILNDARNILYTGNKSREGWSFATAEFIRASLIAGKTYVINISLGGPVAPRIVNALIRKVDLQSDADLFGYGWDGYNTYLTQQCLYNYDINLSPEGDGSFSIRPIRESDNTSFLIDGEQVGYKLLLMKWQETKHIQITTTSGDGSATRQYNLTIKRPYSTNAGLDWVTSSDERGFHWEDDSSFKTDLPENVGSVTFTPHPSSKHASYTIDGVKQTSKTVNVKRGETVTSIVEVTAVDGITKKTYRVTVSRAVRQPRLISFGQSVGQFVDGSKSDPQVLGGNLLVLPKNCYTVTLTPKCSFDGVTVYFDGVPAKSRTYTIKPNVLTSVKIKLAADEGKSVQEYSLTIKNTETVYGLLAGLKASFGKLSPSFDPLKHDYTLTLDENISATRITPIMDYLTTKITIDGSRATSKAYSLSPGTHRHVTICVYYTSRKYGTYHLTIVRSPKTNSSLSSLSVRYGVLTPKFGQNTPAYSVLVPANRSYVTVQATKADKYATTIIDGSKTSRKNIKVAYGQKKVITVTCRAQAGGSYSKNWTLTLIRPPKINTFEVSPKILGKPTVQTGVKPVTFLYSLYGAGGNTKLEILTSSGWVTLKEEYVSTHTRKFVWDGTVGGSPLPAGIYTVRLSASSNGYDSAVKTIAVRIK